MYTVCFTRGSDLVGCISSTLDAVCLCLCFAEEARLCGELPEPLLCCARDLIIFALEALLSCVYGCAQDCRRDCVQGRRGAGTQTTFSVLCDSQCPEQERGACAESRCADCVNINLPADTAFAAEGRCMGCMLCMLCMLSCIRCLPRRAWRSPSSQRCWSRAPTDGRTRWTGMRAWCARAP